MKKAIAARRTHHLADRLFLAGCIGAYGLLMAAVITALRLYLG